MVLYDSHAEAQLQAGRRLCMAGLTFAAQPKTLHAYANMSCMMDYEDDASGVEKSES